MGCKICLLDEVQDLGSLSLLDLMFLGDFELNFDPGSRSLVVVFMGREDFQKSELVDTPSSSLHNQDEYQSIL